MRTRYTFLAALFLSLTPCARTFYFLEDEWIGKDFYKGWNWEIEDDPTHGRVNYISQADSVSKNLTYGAVIPLRLLSSARLLAEAWFVFQWRTGRSSCVRTIRPLFLPPRADVTASASRPRRRTANR